MTQQNLTPEEEGLLKQSHENPPSHGLGPEDQDAEPAENFTQDAKDAAISNERDMVVDVLDDQDLPIPT